MFLTALFAMAIGQPYTSYFTSSPGNPANVLKLESKYFQGLNSTNNVECTPYVIDPYFMMSCDKGESQVWMLKNALSTIANKPRTPIATDLYLGFTAVQIRDCYSGTLEFSSIDGSHYSLDSSSGEIKRSQYGITKSDGSYVPIVSGSTTKLFLYQVAYAEGGLYMVVYNRA